jgi:dUTP pyrophosphatase
MHWSGEMVKKCVVEGDVKKVNPNGIDIGVSEVWKIPEGYDVHIHGKERRSTQEKQLVMPGEDGFYHLPRGVYEVRIGVKIKIPGKAVGYCKLRSTLIRFGSIKSESAVWDSGYEGYGTQTVHIPFNMLHIHKDEAWFQFVMQDSADTTESYDGYYQNEVHKDR